MHEANKRTATDTPTEFMVINLFLFSLGGLTRSKSETRMNFENVSTFYFVGFARDRKYEV